MTPRRRHGTSVTALAAPANRLGLAALLVALATLAVLALALSPLVSSYLEPAPAAPAAAATADHQKKFEASLDTYAARIEGRSLFFVPPRPRPRRVEAPRDTAPPPPRTPTSYGGPAILYMVNGAVWLADGQRLSPDKPQGRGVSLVSLDAPWSARLLWEGAEFDVELFKRNALSAPDKSDPPPPLPDEPDPDAEAPDETADPEADLDADGDDPPEPPDPAAPPAAVSPRGPPVPTRPPTTRAPPPPTPQPQRDQE